MENQQLFYFCKNNKLKMLKHFDLRGVNGAFMSMLVIGFFLVQERANAQSRGIFVPYSSVGVGVGTSSYFGDMASFSTPFKSIFGMMRWNASANYTRHFTPRLAARAAFTYARIVGDDYQMNKNDPTNIRFPRNLSFRNDLKEFSLVGIYKLTPDNRSYDRRPQMGVYLFGGIAAVAHNPVARDTTGGKWVKLQPLGTEGQGRPGYAKPYSLIQLAIPVGVGIRYKINSRIDVGAEIGFRFTFTDYLDDVAKGYADPTVFSDNPLALKMSNRSLEQFSTKKGKDRTPELAKYVEAIYGVTGENPFTVLDSRNYGNEGARGNSFDLNDYYFTGTIHVNYVLPTQIKCPPLR